MRGWIRLAVMVSVLGAVFGACASAGADDDDDTSHVDAGKVETNCVDKIDDDGDGDTDCEDEDCSMQPVCRPETICTNGGDDDFDGFTDCLDPDCDGMGFCEYGTELSCADNNDNDGDTLIDCADTDCSEEVHCIPEPDCTNGLDDDEDGQTDCADFDCDGTGFCEFGAEVSCDDGHDNDGDGDTDCDDSDCAVLAACVVGCPDGSDPTTYTASGLPVAIPDPGSAQATVTVPASGIVRKAVVQISINHTYTGDLVIGLQPPNGGPIVLSDRHGSTGENYTDTIFSDDATTAIASGTAPFTGSYQPDEALSVVEGFPAEGTWTLDVSDEASIDSGSITAYSIHLCTCDGTAGCEFGAACQDGIDNDGDNDVDCDDADCAGVIQCTPESPCDDGTDNDLDGHIDCDDADCDGVGICEYGTETTCDDGEDNDADGKADCADTDCSAVTACVPETDCHDGVDNDDDGTTDCQDVGCSSDPTCEIAGETLCADGVDNDSDGLTDCEEAGCALACAIAACSAGDVAVGLAATDLPTAISDLSTVSSTLSVAATGSVARVAVRFSATHTYDGDLDITLVSPSNTVIDLSSDNGSSSDNYTDTIFIDSAATGIATGTAPFNGSYQPEQPLSDLNGEPVLGGWRLDVYDDASSDTGSFTKYELALCVTP